MVNEALAAQQIESAAKMASAAAAPLPVGSAPLEKNPGTLYNIKKFFTGIFDDFYNSFRLVGYLAEGYYSELQRHISDKWQHLAEKPGFHPELLKPDWKSVPRMIVNSIEAALFLGVALIAFTRDRKEYHNELNDVVAAERGKDRSHISLKDMVTSENPLIQTAMNRFKSLYALRFLQPLTFLWGLRLGVTTTVVEIVGERAAYFEKNSFELLEKLTKEIGNNQWGTWSHDGLTSQLVDIIQKNRKEHGAVAIQVQEMEKYMPLLNAVADRLIEKKWGFSETVHVLGQVIKEPAQPQKAMQAYENVETHGLSGIASLKQAGASVPSSNAMQGDAVRETPKNIKEILAQGPKQPVLKPETPSYAAGAGIY